MLCCIRGAISVEKNDREEILSNTKRMIEEILGKNNLDKESIIAMNFTATSDLNKVYPALSAREMGITEAGLMCMQEMFVEGSLEKCIRVSVFADCPFTQKQVRHIYLEKAKMLRPDLTDIQREQ